MKAIVQDRYGSPDVLNFEEVARPTPADNEVLVRVHAASVNALDWHLMRGDPYLARMTLGLAPPRRRSGVGTSRGWSRRSGGRCAGSDASGGVGPFAVQIAKAFGADVTAVCSTRNVELVGSIGADRVIDYTREDFTRDDQRYDVLFDLVGNRTLTEFRRVLTPAGTLILSGGGVFSGGSFFGPLGLIIRGQAAARFVRHRILIFTAEPNSENLAALRELIERELVKPVVDRTYPLSEAAEAIRYLEDEHARAKVVITV